LTNSSPKFDSSDISAYPMKFDASLVDVLQTVDVLHNTYWVRFNHGNFSHAQAVANTMRLFDAAKQAGVGRSYTPCVHTTRGSSFKTGLCLAFLPPSTGIGHQ
jgi:hypothetical protein